MHRALLLALLMLLASLGPAVPAQAFHGCGYDGYQPLLEHGKVFTATLTSNGCYWAPFAGAWKPDPGGPDTVNVGVRVRGSARRSRPAYLRIIPASRRCAASASRGAGDPLGWFPLSGPGSIATGVVRIKRGLFPTPRVIRVCLWITASRVTAPRALSPSRRVKPLSTTIRVFGDLFAASAAHHGALAPPGFNGFSMDSVATFPFYSVRTERGCGEPTTEARLSQPRAVDADKDGLFQGWSQATAGAFPCPDMISTFTFSRQVDGSALGSVSYVDRVRAAAPWAAPIYRLGACALGPGRLNYRAPHEAAAFLRAVGCIPGRLLTSRHRNPAYPDDTVMGFRVAGAPALLAPSGTRVDMVVNRRADSRLADPSQPAPTGRVMTWNIHGKGEEQVKKYADAWAKWIAAFRPDVIGLQETCHKTSGTLLQRRLRDYGLKYYSASGPAPGTSFPVFNVFCGRGSYFRASNTTLSLTPMTAVKNRSLGRTCQRFIPRICRKDLVGRNVLAVTTTVAGRRVRVFNTHIGNGLPETQKKQIDKVASDAARYPQAIVVGDFNVEPGAPPLASLGANGFLDVDHPRNTATYPARDPKRKIDYVFVKGLRPTAPAIVPDIGRASDHRPLYSVVR